MHRASKADGYCLVTWTASYCCTDDSDLSIVKTTVIVLVDTIVSVSDSTPLLSHTQYCPHLRVVLSRYWDHPVDPSLILLSVLIQGCSALSQSHEFDTRYPLVSVTSSESSL